MENDVLDSLIDLGLEGSLGDEEKFSVALDGGLKSLEYAKLVHNLAEQLKTACNLEETVGLMTDPDESSAFLLELSSFLKELGCPYKKLVTGHMSSRLQTREDRILLLDYLISELMAARICAVDRPKEKPAGMQVTIHESPTAKDLKDILIILKFNKPPPNITPEMLFSKLETKFKETLMKEGDQLVGKPLYNKALNEKEWKQLEQSFTEMFEEYRLRRETLITRLECTIQSFEWSERLKNKKDMIQSLYRPLREKLKIKPDVRLSDFLAARTALLQVEKTSSASVRKNTQSEVNKVIIGRVPDRGGRPNEQQPPPPEMPSWQQNRNPGGGRGGGGGGGRGGRGGFNAGGGGFNSDRGGFNSGGGGFNSGGRGGFGGGGGRGGRVQGGYNQGSQGGYNRGSQDDLRTQQTQSSQPRTFQTYEVPPGGYTKSYDSMGGYNQGGGKGGGYQSSGYQSQSQTQSQGYRGGYQNEHDDRNGVNYNRGGGGGGRGRGSYNRGGRY